MNDARATIGRVARRMRELGITEAEAARRIDVTLASLMRHLGGAYIRSDSLAKYRHWLAGNDSANPGPTQRTVEPELSSDLPDLPVVVDNLTGTLIKPRNPHRLVDLFSGCGGLSLGFELVQGGGIFKTTLAIDIEPTMVRVFNANHASQLAHTPVGRCADLSEFLNEAEVLAYYLDHLANVESNRELRTELNEISPLGMTEFLCFIQGVDAAFMEKLVDIRSSSTYRKAYSSISKTSLSQTSILGFHAALKLPRPGTGIPTFDPPLWGSQGDGGPNKSSRLRTIPGLEAHIRRSRTSAKTAWDSEIAKLCDRANGTGTGQLASASAKIAEFLILARGVAFAPVRAAWLDWRGQRDAIRNWYFEHEAVLTQLREIYSRGHQVEVLLGGPPCQGFSRIGRGKIRSLREQSVHVQADIRAGDKRNELLNQYVLFIGALCPAIFLFENVRHFQAEVKTPDGVFKATDVLAEAITNISHDGLHYSVSSRIVIASDHFVPQVRERFFMVGVRSDVHERSRMPSASDWCLRLPKQPQVPLKIALSGLPDPSYTSGITETRGGTKLRLPIEDIHVHGNGASSTFLEWVRQPPPSDRPNHDNKTVDGHCARDSRQDDREFFATLGPGKRWMDYRCDDNPLVRDLRQVVMWASKKALGEKVEGLDRKRLKELVEALDGSLSLRLLLDRIPLGPGELQHHLASPNYLKKQEGSHGDWLARLDAEVPCKTMVSHMGKDTYAYIHPSSPRTISVREAARVQTFPDWFEFGIVGLVDGYRLIGNAVPPLLSNQLALRASHLLELAAIAKDPHLTMISHEDLAEAIP